jgi:hypothetical protein
MRTNTKLKKILLGNTAGLSYSEMWEMTVIDLKTKKRTQFSGKTFSELISKAYAASEKKTAG